MKHIKLLTVCIFLLKLISCKEEEYDILERFDRTINLAKAEQINFMDSIVMNPTCILAYDSLLILKDKYDGRCLSLIDLKSKKIIKRFLKEGQGPNEIIQFGAMYKSYKKREFIVLDIAKSKLLFFNLDSITHNYNTYFKTVQLEKEKGKVLFMTASFVTNDKIVGTGINHIGRYMLTDTSGKTIFKGIEYPYAEKNVDFVTKGLGYQASLTSNANHKKFATITLNGEILEIGQYIDEKLDIVAQLGNRMCKYHNKGRFVKKKNEKVGLCDITSNENQLFILYSGKNYEEHGYSVRDCNTILSVDWNGKPIVKYHTQEPLRHIAFNDKGDYLYAIKTEPEVQVVSYKINSRLPY